MQTAGRWLMKSIWRCSLAGAVLLSGGIVSASAQAESCRALAAEVGRVVDGLTVGRAVSSIIHLEHPQFRRASLGCASRARVNDIFAEAASAKPGAGFYGAVAAAGAIVFSVPIKDVRNGAERCARMSRRRFGREVSTRYRRLTIVCATGRGATRVTVSREPD